MIDLIPGNVASAEEPLADLAFLEWLGQTAEIEDVGINIDDLLEHYEQELEGSAGDGTGEENNQ